MHLFYDSTLNTWRLITENLPEKPHEFIDEIEQYDIWEEYRNEIAALKQNALTVGNPEICPQNMSAVEPDKLYEWPGGYETKEIPPPPIKYVNGTAIGSLSKTVAILTLPEEKKNTMENQVGGVNDLSIISKLTTSDTETMKDITASGSVATPKEEEDEWLCPTCGNKWGSDEGKYCSSSWHLATPLIQKQVASLQFELASLRQQLKERDELIANLKQDIVRLVEDVNKAYEH